MATWEIHSPNNGRPLEILKVGGGWLVRVFCDSEKKSVVFIPDPEHKNKPVPMD